MSYQHISKPRNPAADQHEQRHTSAWRKADWDTCLVSAAREHEALTFPDYEAQAELERNRTRMEAQARDAERESEMLGDAIREADPFATGITWDRE